MKHLFFAAIGLVLFLAVAGLVHYFGWLYAALIVLVVVAAVCTTAIVMLGRVEPANAPRDILNPKPEPELDLTRCLQNRKSPRERDALTETGRVIERDLRTKTNGHAPHSTIRETR